MSFQNILKLFYIIANCDRFRPAANSKLSAQEGSEQMNENQNLRDVLFPDGIPEPEEFIRTVAEYIINQKQNSEPSE